MLPNALIMRQLVKILGRLLLILAVLHQHRACRPEHRPAGAVFGLGEGREPQLARVLPGAGEAEMGVLILDVVGHLLGRESLLIRRLVDPAVSCSWVQY